MRRLLSSLLLVTVACSLGDYSGGVGNLTVGADGGSTGDGGVVPGDLPCDVATLLSTHCTSCHGSPPSGNAPMALDSHAALTAISTSFPGQTYAQRSLIRMQDSASPMPPGAGVSVPSTDIATFASWVDAGTPTGSCAPAGDPVFSAPPQCSSNKVWTQGTNGSSQMQPGVACIACHVTSGDAPNFAIAGTVYPTGHEPNQCDGSAATGATVTVKDKNGTSRSFTVNSAGNFYGGASGGWPVFPITATVSFNGKTRSMATAVPSGDCNGCHTQNGTAVGGIAAPPGRIALP
ncbi:MAG TPA: hypothetical protein VMT11_01860 [Myxococcaceae bacterium]|nr:hypothetical protein [Myxococcaceae bacterium]